MTHEGDALKYYSTPGLRTSVLSYNAKKDHLARLGIKRDDADKILAELYPEEHKERGT